MASRAKNENQSELITARQWERSILILSCGLILVLAEISNLIFSAKFQQYRFLAESFVSGRLSFIQIPRTDWGDAARFAGRYYWPLGVFPAVLLAPFVFVWQIFGSTFHQGYLCFVLSLWSFYLIFRLAKKLGKSSDDAAWIALAFVGSTSYIAIVIVPWSWHLAHIVAVWLLLIAVHEYLDRQRWVILGLIMGLVFATRLTASLSALFFFGALFSRDEPWRTKSSKTILFVSGIIAVVLPVLFYNYVRFGSPFESGYNYQLVPKPNGPLIGAWNVLPNMRTLFFGLPTLIDRFPYLEGNRFGMSIFVVSPWLFLIRPNRWSWPDSLLAATIFLIMLSFLLWWSTGSGQLGYRFSLDFLPLLFWLLLRTNAILVTFPFKMCILVSELLNLYFLFTVFTN